MTRRFQAGLLALGLTFLIGAGQQNEVLKFQNPYLLQDRPDNNRLPIVADLKLASRKLGILSAKSVKNSPEQGDTNRTNSSGPSASIADVKKAVDILQSGTAIRCPEDARYIYKLTSDPSSRLCLSLKDVVVVDPIGSEDFARTRVVFKPALDPAFSRIIDLPATLLAATSEQCGDLTQRLIGYGQFLLQETNVMPAGTTVNVQLAVRGSEILTCQ